MKSIITILIISLPVFLWSCGDDTEETGSVQIPILLKNVLAIPPLIPAISSLNRLDVV